MTLSDWVAEGAEVKVLRRHMSHGTLTVRHLPDGSWSWEADTPRIEARASGKESTQHRAKYRAMLLYFILIQESP